MIHLYLWGTGHYGALAALDCEQKGLPVAGFVDSNPALWGTKQLGVAV
jgi:hypothetical protein